MEKARQEKENMQVRERSSGRGLGEEGGEIVVHQATRSIRCGWEGDTSDLCCQRFDAR